MGPRYQEMKEKRYGRSRVRKYFHYLEVSGEGAI